MTTKVLRIPVLTLYLYELAFSAFYFIRDGGTAAEMPILPFLGSTASVVTILYYSSLALLLYNKLAWRSVFPLIVMGGIQEGVYGGLNLLLTPGFLATAIAFNPFWFVYDFSLAGATVLSFFVQSRLLEPRYRLSWASFVFPAYIVYYALTLTYLVRLTIPGWLNLFIVSLFVSYLKTVNMNKEEEKAIRLKIREEEIAKAAKERDEEKIQQIRAEERLKAKEGGFLKRTLKKAIKDAI